MSDTNMTKPFYKKVWVWAIFIFFIFVLIASKTPNEPSKYGKDNKEEVVQKKNVPEVTIADFSKMSKEEIQNWFDTNKMKGTIVEEYSDTIEKGAFVSQSIESEKVAHQGDKIKVIYSLGKEPTMGQKNALSKAKSYANTMHMSKSRIYNQLTSNYGEGFTAEEANYAIENLDVDWKRNALEKAKSYQNTMHMSKSRIKNQLTSNYGEGFTAEEAEYAIQNLPN